MQSNSEVHRSPSPVLDYQSGLLNLPSVIQELRAAETFAGATLLFKSVAGVALTLLGPLLLTLMAIGIATRSEMSGAPGFLVTFAAVTIVLVPLLMWYERQTSGAFYSDSIRGETSPRQASSYGEYELQSSTFALYAYVELALTGPRLLWEVIDGTRKSDRTGEPLRRVAAEIVLELLASGEGQPIHLLARSDRPLQEVWAATRYLLRLEWVGVSSRRDRVWLASDVRDRLTRR